MIAGNRWISLTVLAAAGIAIALQGAPRAEDLRVEHQMDSLRLAVEDLIHEFPESYSGGKDFLNRLAAMRRALDKGETISAEAFMALRREALLSNPLLDFDEMLVIARVPEGGARREKGTGKGLGEFLGLPRQSSWQQDTIPNLLDWENEIIVLRVPTPNSPEAPAPRTLFRPEKKMLVSDIDLDFDADRLLFAMPGDNRCWQVFELPLRDGAPDGEPRQITPADQPGIHNFDPIHLPDGQILYISTAPLQGVPCNTSVNVAMTYSMNADGSNIRQLCFDQDHNYCPVVMNDGRVMYLRWEYTDIPHVWGRYLFTMNPDGTTQREFYGSGSYWPNSLFYARPIPNHPTQFVGVVTGHHVGRVGELYLFDPARGHNGVQGVVQRIPGRGQKIEPLIQDKLTDFSWPKFLHPWPLSDKYFIVTAKPTPDDLWGIYLVDVFDNMLLLCEQEDRALLEPIPLRARKRPPTIAPRVDLERADALIYLEDIYAGPGLKDVPRGAVKQLRLFTYHFAFQRLAGISHRVGTDGPWEPKIVLGSVPVESDGSAFFRIPANTPISIQPLDDEGRALQLMRSWTTAMPGEVVSCVGCHERQSGSPPIQKTLAARRVPSEIAPWRPGESPRGFSFQEDVQPVLNRRCVGCHDGSGHGEHPMPDLRDGMARDAWYALPNSNPNGKFIEGQSRDELLNKYAGVFSPSYAALRSYIRVGGLESDIRQQPPGEFHVNTTELYQLLRGGHYGVKLEPGEMLSLVTWIDLNAPCHGTWTDTAGASKAKQNERRRLLRASYGGETADMEVEPASAEKVEFVKPEPVLSPSPPLPEVDGWPFDAATARERQLHAAKALGTEPDRKIDLGGGVSLEMTLIPAGSYVMGTLICPDERPARATRIEKAFWIGKFEVTNEQYNAFDPSHESRYEHKGSWSFSESHLGWPLDAPRQPVVRVSQQEALRFAEWLSEKLGESFFLPSEAEWEYACRAGTATQHWFGDAQADFSPFANMADVTIRDLAYDTDGRYCADLAQRDVRFDDGALVTAAVGSYRPNAWGLFDAHGNVWEWTSSAYRAYDPVIERLVPEGAFSGVAARGGSWFDRPKRCRSAYRLGFPEWQKVFNVGFRLAARASSGNNTLVAKQ